MNNKLDDKNFIHMLLFPFDSFLVNIDEFLECMACVVLPN